MSVARVKKMNLPDAPKPTRSVKYSDPWEKERGEKWQESEGKDLCNLHNGPVKKIQFWDNARLAKLRRLWKEGCPISEIARECGAELTATQNRITLEISYGRVESRKRKLTQDDIERIYRLRDAGMSIKLIAKDMRRSTVTINKVLKERQSNET